MHQILKSVTEYFNLENHNIMSGRGCRGRSRTSALEAPPERYVEHTLRSEDASMNQPPAAGQARPSRPPEGAQVIELFTADQVAQIAQIVAITTRQQSQPTQPPREVIEETGRSIERVQKLGAKPYDGSGDPEAAWLWLDRVNKVYGVMGCTDEQRVLFSSFLMEDRAKDWWDSVERRYPDGISCDGPIRGSVDYPSTCRNTCECRVTRHFSQKSGRVSFVRGALPKYKTCIYLPQTVQYIQYIQSHE